MIGFLSCTLNDMTDTTQTAHATHKPRPLIDLLISILIPSLILMKLSGEARLGPMVRWCWRWPSPSAGAASS